MKNIYAAASLIAVAMLVATSFAAIPVVAYTPPSVWFTLVILTCYGPFTSATATAILTRDHVPIGSITLNCSNPTNHQVRGIITTQVKPNDLHKSITIRVGDSSRTCTGDDPHTAYSAAKCTYLRGGALLNIRPIR